MTLHEEYELARDSRGITVAEFETEKGLKPYSVYPEARNAKPSDIGCFMYRRDQNAILSGLAGRGGWPSSEGKKIKLEKGVYHPKVGGEQKKRGGYGWKTQKVFIAPKDHD